ncbi:MAG: WbqC family protein [Alphaproteobacteria bacterium]
MTNASSKRVAIVQSCYLPWKGYFDLIGAVDEFIFYDDAQYTSGDWRNRNKVKTPSGLVWLTVPVHIKGRLGQRIRDAEINGVEWQKKHWKTLRQYYSNALYYKEISSILYPYYCERSYSSLSELNRLLTKDICEMLQINTKLSSSWDYQLVEGKTERVVSLCQQAGATEYISGPSAKHYIDERQFREANIKLTWFDYSGYPQYPQLWGAFEHNVSIVDVLFNCGSDAKRYLKCGAI